MPEIAFKPLEGLPASLSRSCSIRYRRSEGYTDGAETLYVWDLRLDRAATREEKKWFRSLGGTYGCGWWTIVDHNPTP